MVNENPTFATTNPRYPYVFFDLPMIERDGGLGRAALALKEALELPRNQKYGLPTKRAAKAKLDKLNVPTLRGGIVMRSDGMFVPVIFLAPPEDHYAQSIEDKGILPLRGK